MTSGGQAGTYMLPTRAGVASRLTSGSGSTDTAVPTNFGANLAKIIASRRDDPWDVLDGREVLVRTLLFHGVAVVVRTDGSDCVPPKHLPTDRWARLWPINDSVVWPPLAQVSHRDVTAPQSGRLRGSTCRPRGLGRPRSSVGRTVIAAQLEQCRPTHCPPRRAQFLSLSP